MPNHDNDFTRLELSLPNCLDNFRYFRSRIEPSTKLLVLVKANATSLVLYAISLD